MLTIASVNVNGIRAAYKRGMGSWLAAMGVAIGLLGAFALSRFMDSLLYGINARDMLTFGAVSALLGATTLLATWLPARRASRVRPSIAMRSE